MTKATTTEKTSKTGRKERIKLITPPFRVSFPQVFEAKAVSEDQKKKFSLQMLFRVKADPKKPEEKVVDLSPLKAAVKACLVEKFGADQTKWPKTLRSPFRDGAEKEYEGYGDGIVFCTATSINRPGLVDASLQDIITPTEFYGGCYARAEINPYYYDTKGNKGVAFGLQNIQKIRDGEPFSGRSNPSDVFNSIEESTGSQAEETPDVTGLDV